MPRALKGTNAVIGDVYISYYPVIYLNGDTSAEEVSIGLWDSRDQGTLSFEELQELRSTINKILLQMSSLRNDSRFKAEKSTSG